MLYKCGQRGYTIENTAKKVRYIHHTVLFGESLADIKNLYKVTGFFH